MWVFRGWIKGPNRDLSAYHMNDLDLSGGPRHSRTPYEEGDLELYLVWIDDISHSRLLPMHAVFTSNLTVCVGVHRINPKVVIIIILGR